MPTLTVRQLAEDVYQGLKAQAESPRSEAAHGGPNGLLQQKACGATIYRFHLARRPALWNCHDRA